MSTFTPTAPETSMAASRATWLRRAASTITWPPVARVSESPSNSTLPAETMRTSDWSRRSSGVSVPLPASFSKVSRCTSSAVAPLSSMRMALTLPRPMVTLASAPAADRWMAPRPLTLVLDSSMPSWRSVLPLSVMSPPAAWIRPLLTTLPALLPATRSISTSLPRVLE